MKMHCFHESSLFYLSNSRTGKLYLGSNLTFCPITANSIGGSDSAPLYPTAPLIIPTQKSSKTFTSFLMTFILLPLQLTILKTITWFLRNLTNSPLAKTLLSSHRPQLFPLLIPSCSHLFPQTSSDSFLLILHSLCALSPNAYGPLLQLLPSVPTTLKTVYPVPWPL